MVNKKSKMLKDVGYKKEIKKVKKKVVKIDVGINKNSYLEKEIYDGKY